MKLSIIDINLVQKGLSCPSLHMELAEWLVDWAPELASRCAIRSSSVMRILHSDENRKTFTVNVKLQANDTADFCPTVLFFNSANKPFAQTQTVLLSKIGVNMDPYHKIICISYREKCK